jgi:hypothetical protein
VEKIGIGIEIGIAIDTDTDFDPDPDYRNLGLVAATLLQVDLMSTRGWMKISPSPTRAKACNLEKFSSMVFSH